MRKMIFGLFLWVIGMQVIAVDLLNEDFSGVFPPAEWSLEGSNNGENWVQSNFNNAGGVAPEAMFTWEPGTVGAQYLNLPVLDVQDYQDLTLSFTYSVENYSGAGTYSLAVRSYDFFSGWEDIWSVSPSADINATTVNIPIDLQYFDTGSMALSFYFDGDSYEIESWNVDNVVVSAATRIATGTWSSWSTQVIDVNVLIPSGEELTIEPGVSVVFAGPYDITLEGSVTAAGTADSPITFQPQTPGIETGQIFIEGSEAAGATFEYCNFNGLRNDEQFLNDEMSGAVTIIDTDIVVQFDHCVFSANTAYQNGGAIGVENGTLTLENCQFINNHCHSYGGAIYAGSNATLTMDNTLFGGNSAQLGGAIDASHAEDVVMTRCTFSDNDGTLYDGDIFVGTSAGETVSLDIDYSVYWDSDTFFIQGWGDGTVIIHVDNSCIQDRFNAFEGDNVAAYQTDVFQTDPLLDAGYAPTWSNYPIWDDTRSLLIDGADTSFGPDPDNTIADIGAMFYDQGEHVPWTVSGLWSAENSPYLIGGPVVVPAGQTLMIDPGVTVLFSDRFEMVVNGSLHAMGTEEDSIFFDAQDPIHGSGRISIMHSETENTCSFAYCDIRNTVWTDSGYYASGGAMRLDGTEATFSHCTFMNNQVGYGCGRAISIDYSTVSIDNCRFIGNSAQNQGGAIELNLSTTLDITNSVFAYNSTLQDEAGAIMASNFATLIVDESTFYDNPSGEESTIALGPSSSITMTNSAMYGMTTYGIQKHTGTCSAFVDYCLFYGFSDPIDTNIGNLQIFHIIQDMPPTFVDEMNYDFNPTPYSVCVDAGDPAVLDPDMTTTDIGYGYVDQGKPVIQHVHDIPGDQGHQVQILWEAGSADNHYNYQSYYSVWRLDDVVRDSTVLVFEDPNQLIQEAQSLEQTCYWRPDDSSWALVATIPALMNQTYIYNAPTLADSSTAGLNDATFKIVHHCQNDYWVSEPVSGYSVDNIAPNPASTLTLEPNGQQLSLSWTEVTEGTYQGNSYPELNGVWYKVYGSTSPGFACNEDTYLFTTGDTNLILDPEGEARMFYRIIVTDQQPVE